MPLSASGASAQVEDVRVARLGRVTKATGTFLMALVASFIDAAGRK